MSEREPDTLSACLGGGQTPWGRWWRRRAVRRVASLGTLAATRVLAEVVMADTDAAVTEIARRALAELRDQAAIDAVCDVLIATGDERLDDLIRRQGWLPSDPARRALLLFLAGDFDRYAELDFDGSLLAATHSAADEGLRARLAERARAAGRVEWVHAVAGGQDARRLGQLSDREWEAAVGVLATTGRWEQLWRLALEAPPVWGARMLRELGQRSWQPSTEADRAGSEELTTLAQACAADVPDGLVEEAAVLKGHTAGVWCLSVTPDGGLLASGSLDGTVRLWKLPSGAPAGRLNGHTGRVGCLAVSPDGGLLASGGEDESVRLWKLPSGTPAGTLTGHSRGVGCLAVSPDGGLLASGSVRGTLRLWRLPSGAPAGTLTGHKAGVWCLAVSQDGGLLASGGSDGTVRLWRLPSGAPAGRLTGHTGRVGCLAVSPDGGLLASGGSDGTVRLWRLPLGAPAGTLPGHTSVGCLAVTPDGGLLASGHGDKIVRLWQLPSGAPVADEGTGVSCLAVSPDGGLLASGSWDGTVRLWKLPSGAPAGTRTGHTSIVLCLAVSPDGLLLASGSWDGTVRLWGSSLRAASRTPVGDLAPAEVQRLLHATNDQPPEATERSWALLIAALVGWRRRHDIELADAGLADATGVSDIELEG